MDPCARCVISRDDRKPTAARRMSECEGTGEIGWTGQLYLLGSLPGIGRRSQTMHRPVPCKSRQGLHVLGIAEIPLQLLDQPEPIVPCRPPLGC
jgi:hypothetical protein